MIVVGSKLYIKPSLPKVNLRIFPDVKSAGKQLLEVQGQYLGVCVEVRKVGAAEWYRIDYPNAKYVWVLAGNVDGEFRKSELIYQRPGAKVRLLTSLAPGAQSIPAPAKPVGNVRRVVLSGPGQIYLEIDGYKSGNTTFYVAANYVVGAQALTSQINQVAAIDKRLLQAGLLAQNSINTMKAKGWKMGAHQAWLNAGMARLTVRQGKINTALKEGQVNVFARLDSKTQALQDKVKGLSGLGNLGALPPWLIVALVVAVVVGVAVVSINSYQYFFEDKPKEAAEFDLTKIEKFRQALAGASTEEEAQAIMRTFQKEIKKYGDDSFDDGESAADDGLFGGIEKGVKYAVLAFAAVMLAPVLQKEFVSKTRRK